MSTNSLLSLVGAAFALLLLAACSGGGSASVSSGGSQSSGSAFIVLTDAAVDDLSSFQIDVTEISLRAEGGDVVDVFPETEGDVQTLNLLDLQGVNAFMGGVDLPVGTYHEIDFAFENAQAVDTASYALNVLPSDSGTIRVKLRPVVTIAEGASTAIQLDFDVNNSLREVVPGQGGSVVWAPVIVAKEEGAADIEVEDLRLRVASVSAETFTVNLRNREMTVTTTATTVLEDAEGNQVTGPADLTGYLEEGDRVKVDGLLDAAHGELEASSIEVLREHAEHEKVREVRGVIEEVGEDSFAILVTNGDGHERRPGSRITYSFNTETVFSYDEPEAEAASSNLRVGQEVEVEAGEGGLATHVELRETRLKGEIVEIDEAEELMVIDVSRIEKFSVEAFDDFNVRVVASFVDGLPENGALGDLIVAEGNFGIGGNNVFRVHEYELEDAEEAERGAEFEGESAEVLTSDPLTFRLVGEGEGALDGRESVVVALGEDVTILRRSGDSWLREQSEAEHEHEEIHSVETITAAELAEIIDAASFSEIKVVGEYDNDSETLTARTVRVEMERDEGEGEGDSNRGVSMEGESYSLISTEPFSFQLTGRGHGFEENTTVTVVLAEGAVLALRPAIGEIRSIELPAFIEGISNTVYHEIRLEGTYDADTTTITASFVKATEEGHGEIDVAEAESVAEVEANAASFVLLHAWAELDDAEVHDETIAVELAEGAGLWVRNDGEHPRYDELGGEALQALLASGEFDEVRVAGFWDSENNLLIAHEVKVRIRHAEEDSENESEGEEGEEQGGEETQ